MKIPTAVFALAVAAGPALANDRMELVTEGAARSSAGEHHAAIAAYEKAYLVEQDPALLPILGSEYRKAGLPLDAIERFCSYLAVQPKGSHAAFSALQVRAIRAELGERTTGDVCARPAPLRIDFLTPKSRKGRSMSKRELAGIATGTLGLASLAVALYYSAEARAISDQISSHAAGEPWPANIQDLEERGQRYEDRQNLFLIAGSAALVTGGVLYFLGRTDRMSSENVVVTPTVTPGGGGISLSRGF